MTLLLDYREAKTRHELTQILTTRRPGRSKSEARFIREYIDTLPGVEVDGYGNRRVTVGGASAPPVLWSCHTDTVHTFGGTQTIVQDGDFIKLHKDETQSNCLGADDGTGIWLMRQMILRGVKGTYVFHRDEESGGGGSDWILRNDLNFLMQFQCAIALDRKGYHSVITHQGGRCCSDTFARSLASNLGGGFAPDSTGVFTDTAVYVDIIPECSNLSVGYGAQHFKNEAQNVPFALDLLDMLCALDVRDLTIERDPNEVEVFESRRSRYVWSDYMEDVNAELRDEYDTPSYSYTSSSHAEFHKLLRLVEQYPDEVADMLEQQGYDARELAAMIGVKH